MSCIPQFCIRRSQARTLLSRSGAVLLPVAYIFASDGFKAKPVPFVGCKSKQKSQK